MFKSRILRENVEIEKDILETMDIKMSLMTKFFVHVSREMNVKLDEVSGFMMW